VTLMVLLLAGLAGLVRLAEASPLPVWQLDLAASDGGLATGGQTDQWGWDDPAVGPTGLGACWGTNPDALYLHDTVDWLEVQLPDLSGIDEPTLILRHWYAIAVGDTGVIELDDGSGFQRIDPVYGYPEPEGYVGRTGGYVDAVVDLRGQVGSPRLRLTLQSDAALADLGWYVQHLALYDGDVVAPTLAPLSVPADTQDLDGPYSVELDIVDDRGVASAIVWAEVRGDLIAVPMVPPATGVRWHADLPGQAPGTTVSYWVEATDGQNVGRWPSAGSAAFRVFLAAPTDLGLANGDGTHAVATEVDLSWAPPESPHPVLGYRVHRELGIGIAAEVVEPTARVVVADPQRYWVEAVYEAGAGDPSETLQLDVEVPRLLEIRPEVAFQGQHLYVHLAGSSLYLLEGLSSLDMGPDVRIVELDVIDVNAATARVEIAPDAAVGPLALALEGTAGSFTFPDRFRVRDGADAPHITRITPAEAGQGEQVDIELEASVPFAGAPVITVDDDLVVTSDVEVDGAVARFGIAVSGRARLGLHSLAVDDGDRLYTVDLLVEETVSLLDPGCRCSGSGGSGAWAALALSLAALGRRRSKRARTARPAQLATAR
jgi:uncharacterized protein (TIGR03382 family)